MMARLHEQVWEGKSTSTCVSTQFLQVIKQLEGKNFFLKASNWWLSYTLIYKISGPFQKT